MTVAIRILENIEDMALVEDLQRQVWPGSELDVVPGHLLLTAAHNGGLVIGAFDTVSKNQPPALVGFVFGFPGLYFTPDGPRPKHCSHMLGVEPTYRNQGIGFLLKRAQWQMVRHQGLDSITWTFDPLLSRNANLNITKLGAVSNTYLRELYGEMRDGLNTGLPSDRLQLDWWVNSRRVNRRLSRRARQPLDLANYYAAGVKIVNPTEVIDETWPVPAEETSLPVLEKQPDNDPPAILLMEIPADFQALKETQPSLALHWRLHTRSLFEILFQYGYLITDFIYQPGKHPRSFYVLSYGESTL
ncbi:MAG: GNAT family N-acetyltransferase [Anaerolineales bacterium]|nr:MAG: GNAT family N-acetyltransferase [Anaerolineales bacterium]